MSVLLEVSDLVKEFPGVRAVNGVSFEMRAGSCFGLLGPNGAGKTTTVEILEGIHAPTSGKVLFRGRAADRSFRDRCGIQFQSTALPDHLTVREVMRLFASFYRQPADLAELVSLCRLEEYLDRDTSKLSGGQRQRALLALALVGDPEIVFIDEPTTGLDPQARRGFWELVRLIRARGKTLLLTTHYMEEAYELCDEIAIMDRGRIIARGAPDALLSEHFEETLVEIPVDELPQSLDLASLPARAAHAHGFVELATLEVNPLLTALISAGVPLRRAKLRPPSLEDLFLALTGGHAKDKG